MGRQKAPTFGELEWSLGETPAEPLPAVPGDGEEIPPHSQGFGEIEIELDSSPDVGSLEEAIPTSSARPRVAHGATRMGNVDDAVLALARGEADEPPVANRGSMFPTAGGSGARALAIAAIREAYGSGDPNEALALASELGAHLGVGESADGAEGPDPSSPGFDAADGTAIVEAGGRASQLPAMISSADVPRVLLSPAEIAQLALDHRAGFLLAYVDGRQSMEEILDVCAMPEADALAILERLCALGVIALR